MASELTDRRNDEILRACRRRSRRGARVELGTGNGLLEPVAHWRGNEWGSPLAGRPLAEIALVCDIDGDHWVIWDGALDFLYAEAVDVDVEVDGIIRELRAAARGVKDGSVVLVDRGAA